MYKYILELIFTKIIYSNLSVERHTTKLKCLVIEFVSFSAIYSYVLRNNQYVYHLQYTSTVLTKDRVEHCQMQEIQILLREVSLRELSIILEVYIYT